MNIGVGARALGMSNSVVASVNDVHAGYWNPANLTRVESKFQIGLMHAAYFAGIANYDYGAGVVPLEKGVVGFSIIRFGVDNILNTTNLKDPNGNFNYSRISKFSTADYAFMVSYGRKLGDAFSVGGNAKIIYRQIGSFANAWGFGLDAGVTYAKNHLSAAAMVRDITTTVNAWSYSLDEQTRKVFEETGNEIPTNGTEITIPKLLLGVSYEFVIKEKFVILPEIDLDFTFDGMRPVLVSSGSMSIDPHIGLELSYNEFIYLRGGLGNIQKEPKREGDGYNYLMMPNFGVGIRIGKLFGVTSLVLDYALTNLGGQDGMLYSNVFSLRFDFNGKE